MVPHKTRLNERYHLDILLSPKAKFWKLQEFAQSFGVAVRLWGNVYACSVDHYLHSLDPARMVYSADQYILLFVYRRICVLVIELLSCN